MRSEGKRTLCDAAYGFQYCRQVFVHGRIGKPQHGISLNVEERLSLGILLTRPGLDAPIELDDETTIRTTEVDHERPDGMLPANLQACQFAIPYFIP